MRTLKCRKCSGGVFTQENDGKCIQLVSNDDVAGLIENQQADFALYGSDKYNELPDETPLVFEPVQELNCRFALLKPEDQDLSEAISVATSYPNALAKYALENCIKIEQVIPASGKVEGYVASGMADAAFDIVQTGISARDNGLKVWQEGDVVELGGLWLDNDRNQKGDK
jgi:ATP phosphoribosyltransferase